MIMANFMPRPVWDRTPTMIPAAAQVVAISMERFPPSAREPTIPRRPRRVAARNQLTPMVVRMAYMAERKGERFSHIRK